MAIKFNDAEVDKKFEITSAIEKDFQIRVPALMYSGAFSDITVEVAEQLVKEKYNHIKAKTAAK